MSGLRRFPLGQAALLIALAVLAGWFASLQGEWPTWHAPARGRLAIALALVVGWLALCAFAIVRQRRARRADRSGTALRVVHASQTGFGEEIARQSAVALASAGIDAVAMPIAALDAQALAAARRILFVASTTGEGDAPDGAAGFVRAVMGGRPDLRSLEYGLIALGDSEYTHFCAFGRRLDAWLRTCGARPLFDRVEVDDGDPAALRHWQHHLGVLAGRTDLPDWTPPQYTDWRLVARRELNAGSAGGAVFHLELVPADGAMPDWRAGDLVEIGPCNAPDAVEAELARLGLNGAVAVAHAGRSVALRDRLARSMLPVSDDAHVESAQVLSDRLVPLPHREYSIASIPADGAVHLLVRRMLRADGTPGLGSGWLTTHMAADGTLGLRIRANANFHAPPDARPLILIGNGTGIAGLRALLRERIAAGRKRNWLLFGERNGDRDFHYGGEIRAWHRNGDIEHLDLAFSRDAPERVYVQQRLAERADRLCEWVAAGASIHVCGSLQGMAPGVHAVLVDVLGAETVERLHAEGRYRRDVY